MFCNQELLYFRRGHPTSCMIFLSVSSRWVILENCASNNFKLELPKKKSFFGDSYLTD